jgi:hypothetical protein
MRCDAMRCDVMWLGNWRKILCFQSVCSFKCFPEGFFGVEILAGLRLPDFKLYNERIRFNGWFLKRNRGLWQNCYLNAKILLQTEVPDFSFVNSPRSSLVSAIWSDFFVSPCNSFSHPYPVTSLLLLDRPISASIHWRNFHHLQHIFNKFCHRIYWCQYDNTHEKQLLVYAICDQFLTFITFR